MRLVQRDADLLDLARPRTKLAATNRGHESVEHDLRQELGGRVATGELGYLVEVAEVAHDLEDSAASPAQPSVMINRNCVPRSPRKASRLLCMSSVLTRNLSCPCSAAVRKKSSSSVHTLPGADHFLAGREDEVARLCLDALTPAPR